jgi:hypothetical protein
MTTNVILGPKEKLQMSIFVTLKLKYLFALIVNVRFEVSFSLKLLKMTIFISNLKCSVGHSILIEG